ncbi:type II toxin-antitoxin system RelE family toxin [Methylomonas sp. MK1]|uniref:type II toxin-antitoxin system RelE family toxin n=1 Tax=Methylomonas sp. MK1 TaxID=1131552 RepID=UPI000363B7E1|nr:hypothetical protein [Methylomonas sp. MK1]
MTWTIKLSDDVKRDLSKLDKPVQKCIVTFLQERIQPADNPRASGKALSVGAGRNLITRTG